MLIIVEYVSKSPLFNAGEGVAFEQNINHCDDGGVSILFCIIE